MTAGLPFDIWFIMGSIGALFSLLFALKCRFAQTGVRRCTLAAISLTVFQAGLALLNAGDRIIYLELGSALILFGFWLIPPSWTYFSLRFGRDEPSAKIKVWKPYIIVLTIIGFILFVWALVEVGREFDIVRADSLEALLTSGTMLYFLYILLSSALILVHLENTFRSADRGQKTIIGLMLFFIGTIFASLIYISSQGLIYGHISPNTLKMLITVTSIASIGIFWQSTRLQVFEIKVKLTRATIYSSAVFLLLGVYLLIVGIFARLVQFFGGSWEVFISAIAGFLVVLMLLIILVSQSIQLRARRIAERYFSPERFDYRHQWTEFSESIASITTLDELIESTTNNLRDIFRPDDILVLLSDYEDKRFIPFSAGEGLKGLNLAVDGRLADFLFRSAGPQPVRKIMDDKYVNPELKIFRELGKNFEICIPLVAQQKLTGIMFLGFRQGDRKYSIEDYSFLDTWAHQLAVAVLQVKSAERLAEAREMESYHRFSTFVVHDLKNAVSMLGMLLKNAEKNISKPEFQVEALKTISGAVEKMGGVIRKFSSPAKGYDINKTIFPAVRPVDEVVKFSKINELEGIKFVLISDPDIMVNSDPAIIEKIINNLIINAVEAQDGKGKIEVRIKSTDDSVMYSVTDSGPGMNADFINRKLFKAFETTKKKGLGIGLHQCREMAQALEGELTVKSAPDEGTTFFLTLPGSKA